MNKQVTRRVVSKRIVKAFWNCVQCGTQHIDGLVDFCPNCGSHKPKGTKNYIDKNNLVEASKDELAKAGILHDATKEKRPDWLCSFCNSLNNDSDKTCVCCGASQKDSEENYFGSKNNTEEVVRESVDNEEVHESITDDNTNEETKQQYEYVDHEGKEYKSNKRYGKYTRSHNINSILGNIKHLGIASAVIAFIALMIFMLFPYDVETTVSGFEWERGVHIEELKTFKENNWTVPAGGRVYYSQDEIYDYDEVIDYYEEIEVKKSKEEFSHYDYDYDYEYVDNGDGTYTEEKIEIKIPVYETVTWTEIEKVPVYKEVPIYKTKYYYEIDRWVEVYLSKSSGTDKKPYWNTDYTLVDKQRDTKKSESYTVFYDNGSSKLLDYNVWLDTEIGDQVTLTTCRLGIIYSQN